MNGAFHIGTIAGIPIRAHWSLLLAMPLLSLTFAQRFVAAAEAADVPASTLGSPWPWAIALAFALFASILLHELAHALYARRKGVKVADITLLLLGGVSRVGALRAPKQEAAMAALGPFVSLALSALAFALWALLEGTSFKIRFALFCIGNVNLLLGVFNLLPAFPMDGGRVLRALLSHRLGPARATRIAATVGMAFAGLFAVVGIVTFNFVLLLIAFFIYGGAKAEGMHETWRELLGDVRVQELMTTAAGAVDAHTSLAAAADAMLAQRRTALAVVDAGVVVGMLLLDDIRTVPPDQRPQRTAIEKVHRTAAVSPNDTAWRAVELMGENAVPEVPVLQEATLVGTISLGDVERGAKLRDVRRSTRSGSSARARIGSFP